MLMPFPLENSIFLLRSHRPALEWRCCSCDHNSHRRIRLSPRTKKKKQKIRIIARGKSESYALFEYSTISREIDFPFAQIVCQTHLQSMLFQTNKLSLLRSNLFFFRPLIDAVLFSGANESVYNSHTMVNWVRSSSDRTHCYTYPLEVIHALPICCTRYAKPWKKPLLTHNRLYRLHIVNTVITIL